MKSNEDMFLVEKVEFYNAKKARIILEENFTFALYKGEIRKYGIKEGEYVSQDVLDEIIKVVLMKRAREHALYMLRDSSKTKKQISDKLRKHYYPEVVISSVIDFLEAYGYINDYEYASFYIQQCKDLKSINRIKSELYIKGIDGEIITHVLENACVSDDDAVLRLIKKKRSGYNLNELKDRQRFYAMLLRNGFSHQCINDALKKILD